MKNAKKLIFSLCLFFLAVCVSANTFAVTTGKTTLELVEDTVCTINVEDMAKFEKKITKFSKEEKSATLTLSLKNLKESESTTKPVEIFLVIDNSASMRENKVGNITREQAVINSANKLVDKLFDANKNAKVGLVSFSSLDSSKGETEGTINDGKLLLTLSDSKSKVKETISSIPTTNAGSRTNIEAGITIASQNYTKNDNTNRYIVLLTDGCPNNDLSGTFATYSGSVATNTKSKLQSIEKNGVKIIGSMIGLDGSKKEQQSGKTYQALAEEVFGTTSNSTISSFYYINDSANEIESTIVNKLFSDIIVKKDNTLKNFVIKDYFPQEIIDNFDFKYVASPNIGSITQEVNKKDNSITWTIAELKEGETATVSYKLNLKDNFNKEIIDKILPTNTKVDLTGEDSDGKKYDKTSTDSPKVRVLQDTTIAKTVIPQAGEGNIVSILIVIAVTISAIAGIKYIYLNK